MNDIYVNYYNKIKIKKKKIKQIIDQLFFCEKRKKYYIIFFDIDLKYLNKNFISFYFILNNYYRYI